MNRPKQTPQGLPPRIYDLTRTPAFAEGDNRFCFVHPEDPSRCLKIMKPGQVERLFARAAWYKKLRGRHALDDNRREALAYCQSAIRNGGPRVWNHLPRWYGVTSTTLGPANETDLIRTPEGGIAPTLEALLKFRGLDSALTQSLTALEHWLRQTGVLSRNLLPHNLVARAQGEDFQLFLIDGLGAPGIASLTGLSLAWRRHYIERRIQRMWLRANWEGQGRPGEWAEVERAGR